MLLVQEAVKARIENQIDALLVAHAKDPKKLHDSYRRQLDRLEQKPQGIDIGDITSFPSGMVEIVDRSVILDEINRMRAQDEELDRILREEGSEAMQAAIRRIQKEHRS